MPVRRSTSMWHRAVNGLVVALIAAMLLPGMASPASKADSLSAAIEREVRAGFSGSVLIVADDHVLVDRGFGSLHGYAFATSTRFWIASMGKQFVSALLVKLQDEGKLSLADPLVRFIPDAPADKQGITLLQLLSHTSGLPQGYEGEAAAGGADAIRRILAVPLAETPGGKFQYSNDNYQLAAAIAERVGGRSYGELLQQELLAPLRLHDTGLGEAARDHIAPTREATPVRLARRSWGIEGTYSTTHDLLAWFRALRSGRVVSSAGVQELFAPVTPIQEGQAALGWFWRRTPLGTECLFSRGNDDFGPNALLYAYPAKKTIVIVLSHAGEKNDDLSYSRGMLQAVETALKL